MGFVTIAMVLLTIGYFIMQIIKFAFLSKDRFSSLALIGIATIFISHVFINTAMTVGLIPVKGLTFSFYFCRWIIFDNKFPNDRYCFKIKCELFGLIKLFEGMV